LLPDASHTVPTSERRQPSLFRIITTDRLAFILAIIPIVVWVLLFIGILTDTLSDVRWSFSPLSELPIAAGITIIVIPLCIWRVRVVWKLLTQGTLVAGWVTNLVFFRDRGRIDYHYIYGENEWKAQAGVMKVKRTEAMATRKDITVVVDPKKPSRTLIWDLFV